MKKMKKIYSISLLIILSAFVFSGCFGRPQSELSTVSNSGFLKIIAIPDDAQVYIDGVLTGSARDFDGRVKVLELTSGKHKIELKAQGYYSYSRDVMVGARATKDFNITLSKEK